MVTPARFERAAYRLGICCSILLSYGAKIFTHDQCGVFLGVASLFYLNQFNFHHFSRICQA